MNKSISFEIIDYNEKISDSSETLFTTIPWISFLEKENVGKLITLQINFEGKTLYFIGFLFKKGLIKMIGSPFEGWSTPYMGFIGISSLPDKEKSFIIKKTVNFLFKTYKCKYIQICDDSIDINFAKKYKFKFEIFHTLYLDISKNEDDLFQSFKKDVRTNCRNFLKRGASLSIVKPDEEFCCDYYNQLVDVFDKQGLESFYSKTKISNLFKTFDNYEGNILCQNVYGLDGKTSIATTIFLGYKNKCYFFGAASLRDFQLLRPNEYSIWNALKYWKNNGCCVCDLNGFRSYKTKFSTNNVFIPKLYFEKIPGLHFAKKVIKKILLSRRKK